MPKLTPRQQLFVSEYAIDRNASQAYHRAFKTNKGIDVKSSQMMNIPAVRNAVDLRVAKIETKLGINAERVLMELGYVALADPREAFNFDGSLKAIHEMPEAIRRAVSSIEVDDLTEGVGEDRRVMGKTRKVKFWDKPKGLELIGRYLKMFIDRHEVTGKDGEPLQPPMDMSKLDIATLEKLALLSDVLK